MELIRGLHNLTRMRRTLAGTGCALTIGNFDGVHCGHKRVIAQLRLRADQLGLPAWAMFFEPQPMEFLAPDKAPPRLTGFKTKVRLLAEQPLDALICLPFNKQFAGLTAQAFIEHVLVDQLNVKQLIVGDDFRFGGNREGDFSMLVRYGQQYGFDVERIDTHVSGAERASSTRVRHALLQGDFIQAEALLARPYTMHGKVIVGRSLGRTLNVPTANIAVTGQMPPLSGVYVVEVELPGHGELVPGVANLGVKPTLGDEMGLLLEVHLLDFSEDLYGQELTVYFRNKIRDERDFGSLEALKQQINKDIETTRSYFQSIKASQ